MHEPLVPRGWPAVDDLVCGFGDRFAGPPAETLLVRLQVHGTGIVDAGASHPLAPPDPADGLSRIAVDADALVAASGGVVVGVRTADCVPILLVAPERRWAAAVHAGWRGTIAGIAREAVRAAAAAAIAPADIHAALGPSIGRCCYEVSPELAQDFVRADLAQPDAVARDGPRPHLDLRDANRILLERSGVRLENIELVGPCTRCAHERFHSFRADPVSAGRQVSWIGWNRR